MKSLAQKIRRYFTEPIIPDYLLQITPSRLTGLRVGEGKQKGQKYFILPLAPGIIDPSAERSNLSRPDELLSAIRQGLKKLEADGGAVSLLLPEACFRVFILTMETLPPSFKEQVALIRWRVKKLFPVLPDDFRLDYQIFRLPSAFRLLVVGARASVIQEYENLLAKAGYPVRTISVPSLHLISLTKKPDFVLANLERDSLALLAVVGGAPLLYRLKVFRQEKEGSRDFISQSLAEIENTLHFLEDKEKKRFNEISLRWGLDTETDYGLIDHLRQHGLDVVRFDSLAYPILKAREQEILAPLLGQARRDAE